MAPKSLRAGRPPLSKSDSKASLSAKATRTLIRSHHTLQKRLQQARRANDTTKVQAIEAEIASTGGLTSYQLASILGQSNSRGGDSSRILVSWLSAELNQAKVQSQPLRVLEVGALSTTNALNSNSTLVRRIDLHSQGPGIEEIDFMELDPANGHDYDILSLSLVLNYVPDSSGRGEMLRRTTTFLRQPKQDNEAEQLLPALFLVLPLPCVQNSRYLDAERLDLIMGSLGYVQTRVKESKKLYYSLWRYEGKPGEKKARVFRKEELRKGGSRNNFAIVLDEADSGKGTRGNSKNERNYKLAS